MPDSPGNDDPLMRLVQGPGAKRVESIAFSADGKWLVTGHADTKLRVWDVATGMAVCHLDGHEAAVTTVAFAPDGRTVFSGSGDGQAVEHAQPRTNPVMPGSYVVPTSAVDGRQIISPVEERPVQPLPFPGPYPNTGQQRC